MYKFSIINEITFDCITYETLYARVYVNSIELNTATAYYIRDFWGKSAWGSSEYDKRMYLSNEAFNQLYDILLKNLIK